MGIVFVHDNRARYKSPDCKDQETDYARWIFEAWERLLANHFRSLENPQNPYGDDVYPSICLVPRTQHLYIVSLVLENFRHDLLEGARMDCQQVIRRELEPPHHLRIYGLDTSSYYWSSYYWTLSRENMWINLQQFAEIARAIDAATRKMAPTDG